MSIHRQVYLTHPCSGAFVTALVSFAESSSFCVDTGSLEPATHQLYLYVRRAFNFSRKSITTLYGVRISLHIWR
jgi:hypothetical protein